MTEIPTIITERVDDIPLLLEQMQRMGLPTLLDTHFPTHGNWTGLSLSWVSTIWLSSILSQGDHRLVHVEPWVATRLWTLGVTLVKWLGALISLTTVSKSYCDTEAMTHGGLP